MGDEIFLTERIKGKINNDKKRDNFNIVKFNDEYFNKFLKLFKYSLNANKNKRDIKNYDDYIIKSLENIEIVYLNVIKSKK